MHKLLPSRYNQFDRYTRASRIRTIVSSLALLFVFGLLAATSYGQATAPAPYSDTTRVSFVRSWDATAPITDSATLVGRPLTDVKMTTQYVDGLGRPWQTVNRQSSPLGNDQVTAIVYDNFGRESYKYLPFTANVSQTGDVASDGSFKLDPFVEQAAFATTQYPGQTYYYGQTNFEASPLNRPLTALPAGNSWVGSSRGTTLQYLVNLASDSVESWNIDTLQGSKPVGAGFYPYGQLIKTVTTDEQNHAVIEYKDKLGLVLLKKVQNWNSPATGPSGWLCTYYVYDILNNLRFVIQPDAVQWLQANSWSFAASGGAAVASELCFRYEYDQRKRMIIKKVPGAGEVWMVYDARDRLVMTQDSVSRLAGFWLVTKYDNLNRPDSTGELTDANNRVYHQNLAYNSTSYPSTSGGNYAFETQTFYDDYTWMAGRTSRTSSLITKYTSNASYFFTSYNTAPTYAVPIVQSPQTRGLVTGTWGKVYGVTFNIMTINKYDDHARVIQTVEDNFSNTVDTVTTQYDFAGKPLRTLLGHADSHNGGIYHKLLTKWNYDPMLRLKSTFTNLDSAATDQLVDSLQYDELGQVRAKYLGNQVDSEVYAYNIRGWLSSINQAYLKSTTLPGAAPLNYFGMELGYDNTTAALTSTTYKNPQYNGNIGGTLWKSAGDGVARQYDFSYDNVNRLTKADFNQLAGSSWGKSDAFNTSIGMDFSTTNLSYDANGNILSMNQQGFKLGGATTIDQLTYNYVTTSNKLNQVNDAANDSASTLGDFHYKTSSGAIYQYDGNGNLLTDGNKGINKISYYDNNLPNTILFGNKGSITYNYDAYGNKVRKLVADSATKHYTGTFYLGPFVYRYVDSIGVSPTYKDTLQFVSTPEGRARWANHYYTNKTTAFGWEYDFFEKDHLGNTRVILTQEKDTATYLASMEAINRTTENALFYNIPQTCVARSTADGYPVDLGTTNPNDSVAKVRGDLQKVGPAIILKVMAGDVVAMSTNYFYNSSATSPGSQLSASDLLNALASGIVSASGTAHGSFAALTGSSTPLNGALTSFISNNNATASGKPNAYLNYMLLSNQLNYVSAGSGALQVGTAGTASGGTLQLPLITSLHVPVSGYLYIYVSNSTPYWDVFFDNLKISQVAGPLTEENHYYPYGLTMAGISDKSLLPGYAQNKYRYNGKELQNQEFSDGSGLEEYDYGARLQDPQLGRWLVIDPYSEKMRKWSPYCYGADKPNKLIDIEGKIIGNPDDPMTKKVQTLLNKTQAGQELWVQMEASSRTIFFHDIHSDEKLNTKSENNLLSFIKKTQADAITLSKTGYAQALKGKSVDLPIIGTFNKHTGMYDKTSDWDETHVVFENGGLVISYASQIQIKASLNGVTLTQEESDEATAMSSISHESEHTVQDYFDYYNADYNSETNIYTENTTNDKSWNEEKNEQEAEDKKRTIINQLFQIYISNKNNLKILTHSKEELSHEK